MFDAVFYLHAICKLTTDWIMLWSMWVLIQKWRTNLPRRGGGQRREQSARAAQKTLILGLVIRMRVDPNWSKKICSRFPNIVTNYKDCSKNKRRVSIWANNAKQFSHQQRQQQTRGKLQQFWKAHSSNMVPSSIDAINVIYIIIGSIRYDKIRFDSYGFDAYDKIRYDLYGTLKSIDRSH